MSEPTNTQTKERTLTVGVNTPVMFRQGDGHHDGWELKLKAPTNPNRKAEIGPPDSSGWSLQINNLYTHTAVIECPPPQGAENPPPDHVMVIWQGSSDEYDNPSFHTTIRGRLLPCTWGGGGGGIGGSAGTAPNRDFRLDIIDGLVFLVEQESRTGVGSPVKIAAYKRQGESSSDEDRVPVYVDWSAVNAPNLIFRESIPNTDAGEGDDPMMAGNILDRENEENMRQTEVWVESSEKGVFTVKARVDEDGDSGASSYTLEAIVHVYDIALVVDANRDRRITVADRLLVTEENPWRFWYNDDRDFKGETARHEYNQPEAFLWNDFGKYYDSPPPISNSTIHPVIRDFTDLYPLLVDVKNHHERNPGDEGVMTHEYKLEILKPDGSKFGIFSKLKSFAIFSSLNAHSSGMYLSELETAQQIADIQINNSYRSLARLGSSSSIEFNQEMRSNEIHGEFINGMLDGSGGILLMQHIGPKNTVTRAIIRLSVFDPNDVDVVLTKDLHLSLSSVEMMFAHLDLTSQTKHDHSNTSRYVWALETEQEIEPENYPDELTENTRIVYVHGYNINMIASRGANAEIFKRLHLLGSRAKFIAVSWYGWQGQVFHYSIDPGYRSAEYQQNVINSFNTAQAFAFVLNATELPIYKQKTVVLAHSLGNMLVSSAIQDHDLNVDKYYSLKSAVSQEAYISVQNNEYTVDDNMIHKDWAQFHNTVDRVLYEKLFAFNWHRLFESENGGPDSREMLTWDGRFNNVPSQTNMINLWSLGDKVFFPHPQNIDPRTHLLTLFNVFSNDTFAFFLQEKLKGRGGILNNQGWKALGNEKVGGWGFNELYQEILDDQMLAHTIPPNLLKVNPYFIKGALRIGIDLHENWIRNSYNALYDNDPEVTNDREFRNTLLAVMIPSRKGAMGRADVANSESSIGVTQNIEIQNRFNNGGWPINYGSPEFWNHDHTQTIALTYTFKFYDFLIRDGELR